MFLPGKANWVGRISWKSASTDLFLDGWAYRIKDLYFCSDTAKKREIDVFRFK